MQVWLALHHSILWKGRGNVFGVSRRRLRSLGELLDAHMERAAYHTVREVDPETGDHVWRAAIGEPIPGEISERIGEIVDTLRSPLDEIAWNFARLHDDPPPDNTSFIVTRTEEEWDAEKWHIEGVGPDAARVIEKLQPYKMSHPAAPVEQHPLWVLDRLWNADEAHVPARRSGGPAAGASTHQHVRFQGRHSSSTQRQIWAV